MRYALVLIIPLASFIAIYKGSIWSFSGPILAFAILPFIELMTHGSEKNYSEIEESLETDNKIYDFLMYSLVPIQYGLLFYFLYRTSFTYLEIYEIIGMIISFGISCAVLGVNAAHELGHRQTKFEQILAKMLLLTSLYMHFFIEHNRGHHKRVATDEDPASSRRGESVYAFYIRSIRDSYLSAWHLEKVKLNRSGEAFFSLKNEMIIYQIIQISFLIFIGVYYGIITMIYFVLAALVGILLLETVNYIQHYGLKRKSMANGYEITKPIHSWNSNHPLGRLILLELSRHSDHHYRTNRKFQILRHLNESPQMPTGYPGMMVLSLIPPLWFKVVHKTIDQYKSTEFGKALG